LAAQLGWFLDEFRGEGIRVFTASSSANLDQQEPHSIRQGGNVGALWARACGMRTRIVALTWTDEFQGILVRPADGLRESGDLRGLRLALPSCGRLVDSTRTETLHGFLVTLADAGLGPADAQFVDVEADPLQRVAARANFGAPYSEYARQIGALLRREVDAVYVKGARGLRAGLAAGAQLLVDLRDLSDPWTRVHAGTPRPITANQALIDEHPRIVARFLARVLEVGEWAAAHPAETVAYLSRETHCDPAHVLAAYGNDVHLRMGSSLDAGALDLLRAQNRFLFDWGFIPRLVDIDEWLDPAPLRQAQQLRRELASI
jgi:ABC-type nitrate/sulfonate/bicarbonate transport system substrate-binding protein